MLGRHAARLFLCRSATIGPMAKLRTGKRIRPKKSATTRAHEAKLRRERAHKAKRLRELGWQKRAEPPGPKRRPCYQASGTRLVVHIPPCHSARPLCQWSREARWGAPCFCGRYPFGHRIGSGVCELGTMPATLRVEAHARGWIDVVEADDLDLGELAKTEDEFTWD